MKKKLIVITSGSGNSGTGAIHDYLSNRPDFNSPFFGQEFRLISDPYGIENLYNNFFRNFSLNNSSEALDQFKQYSLNFLKIKYRDKKIIYNEKKFLNEVSNYIKNIKKLEYSGYPQYKRVSKSNTINTVFKIKKIFMKMKNHEFHENKMFLPVKEKEFIKSTKKGIYATQFSGGQVDITSGKFVFSASEAFEIINGKIGRPLKGATLIGNGPDILKQVTMVGDNLELDNGIGTCGKEGQMVPVGVGQPSLKIKKLTVGGTV